MLSPALLLQSYIWFIFFKYRTFISEVKHLIFIQSLEPHRNNPFWHVLSSTKPFKHRFNKSTRLACILKTAIKIFKQSRKTHFFFLFSHEMQIIHFTLEMNHTAPQNIWTILFLHKNVCSVLAYQMQTFGLRKILKVMFNL